MSATDVPRPRRRAQTTRVTGFLPPIATPLLDGKLDLDSLRRQLDYLGDHVEGYLVGGSVGEVASLTMEEREQLMRAACRPRARHEAARLLDLGQLPRALPAAR